MKFVVITALLAMAGFFACQTTSRDSQSSVKDDQSNANQAPVMALPAAEALLTVLYGN